MVKKSLSFCSDSLSSARSKRQLQPDSLVNPDMSGVFNLSTNADEYIVSFHRGYTSSPVFLWTTSWDNFGSIISGRHYIESAHVLSDADCNQCFIQAIALSSQKSFYSQPNFSSW